MIVQSKFVSGSPCCQFNTNPHQNQAPYPLPLTYNAFNPNVPCMTFGPVDPSFGPVFVQAAPCVPEPPYVAGSSDDLVICRMCLTSFSSVGRLPLSLNCLHTFCEHCLTSWIDTKTHNNKLTCPMCGKVTKIERGRKAKDALPVNRAILELIRASAAGPSTQENKCISAPNPAVSCAPCNVPPTNGCATPGSTEDACITVVAVSHEPIEPRKKHSTGPPRPPPIPAAAARALASTGPGYIPGMEQSNYFAMGGDNCWVPVSRESSQGFLAFEYPNLHCPAGLQDYRNKNQQSSFFDQEPAGSQQQQPQWQPQKSQQWQAQQLQLQQTQQPQQWQAQQQEAGGSFSSDMGFKRIGQPTPLAQMMMKAPESSTEWEAGTAAASNTPSGYSSVESGVSSICIGDVHEFPKHKKQYEPPVSKNILQPPGMTSLQVVGSQFSNSTKSANSCPATTYVQDTWVAPGCHEVKVGAPQIAITALCVNSSPATTKRQSEALVSSCNDKDDTDDVQITSAPYLGKRSNAAGLEQCSHCNIRPAFVSVARSGQVLQLCTDCSEKVKDSVVEKNSANGMENVNRQKVGNGNARKGKTSREEDEIYEESGGCVKLETEPTSAVMADTPTNRRKKTVFKVHDKSGVFPAPCSSSPISFSGEAATIATSSAPVIAPECPVVKATERSKDLSTTAKMGVSTSLDFVVMRGLRENSDARKTLNVTEPASRLQQQQLQQQPPTYQPQLQQQPPKEIKLCLTSSATSSSTRMIEILPTKQRSGKDKVTGERPVSIQIPLQSGSFNAQPANSGQPASKAQAKCRNKPREYVVSPNTSGETSMAERQRHTEKGAGNLCAALYGLPTSSAGSGGGGTWGRRVNGEPSAPEPESAYEVRRQMPFNPQFEQSWDMPPPSESPFASTEYPNVAVTTKNQEAMMSGQERTTTGAGGCEKQGQFPPEANSQVGMWNPPTLRAPPRYDEIMGVLSSPETNQAEKGGGLGRGGGEVRCVGRWGKYGEVGTQPGTFRIPTRISVGPADQGSRGHNSSGRVVVADQANMNVQVFSGGLEGECLSLLRVEGGVNGCCLLSDGTLAVATAARPTGGPGGGGAGVGGGARGAGVITLYNSNGVLKARVSLNNPSPLVNVVRYGAGFIVVQPRALVFFKDTSSQGAAAIPYRTLTEMTSRSQQGQGQLGQQGQRGQGFRQTIQFKDIVDVAVLNQQLIVLLDAGILYTITPDGHIQQTIVPAQQPCGSLSQPTAVAADRSENIIVSDTGNRRVLLFSPTGVYIRTLYDGSSGPQPGGPPGVRGGGSGRGSWPVGVDVNEVGQLLVVVKGDRFAEVIALNYSC